MGTRWTGARIAQEWQSPARGAFLDELRSLRLDVGICGCWLTENLMRERDMAKAVADQFGGILGAAGVNTIYGIVGDSLNGLTDALRCQGKIEWVHVRHEEVAAFAAGAEAHLTGELAVCAGSCGLGDQPWRRLQAILDPAAVVPLGLPKPRSATADPELLWTSNPEPWPRRGDTYGFI